MTTTMTTDTTEPADAELERTRKRTRDRVRRCFSLLLGAVARDWQHCGKAACLRSRRCRGLVCENKHPNPAYKRGAPPAHTAPPSTQALPGHPAKRNGSAKARPF
jgi:hypothetical protein